MTCARRFLGFVRLKFLWSLDVGAWMLERSFLMLFLALALNARAEQPLAESTIVVYNKTASDSTELAKFYAQQRGIAPDHLVGLTCSTEEEISREEYDANIAEPLLEIFKDRHWWTLHETAEHKETVTSSSIHFVAVIKGVPLKIRATATPYPVSRFRTPGGNCPLQICATR